MIGRAARLVMMMVRPPVAFVVLLFAALGMAQAGHPESVHPLFTSVLVIVVSWFVNGTALNDLADEGIDRVGLADARGRPLVSGDATRRQLSALGIAAGCISLAVAWAVSPGVAAVVGGGLLFNAAYSLRPFRLSRRGGVGPALLPLGFVVLPFLVGAFSVRPGLRRDDMIMLSGLYIVFVGRIILKDFRDVDADRLFDKRTFLLRHGRAITCRVSGACWIAGTAVLLLAVPVPSLVAAALVAYVVCALHGLSHLQAAQGFIAEQVAIGAIAQAGRGMAVTLLAHLTVVVNGWPSGAQNVLTLGLVVLFVGTYVATLAERDRVVAIRPY